MTIEKATPAFLLDRSACTALSEKLTVVTIPIAASNHKLYAGGRYSYRYNVQWSETTVKEVIDSTS